jgi:glycosyltransferase involved in cell wall biosynthesis
MRILLAAGIYPPQIGGPATYAKLLVDELPRRGVSLVLEKFSDVDSFPKGIRHLVYFWRVFRQSKDTQLIFAQDAVSVGLPAYCAAVLRRKKFFLRLGGDQAWEQAQVRFGVTEALDEFVASKKKYPLAIQLIRSVQIFVAKRADRIIVPSKYLGGIIEAWGVSKAKIVVVHNTFDAPSLSDARASLKRELGLQEHVLVSAGRLVKWKGFGGLLNVMPAIIKAFVDARLYIIGEGPERAALEEKIKALHLQDRITLLGALPQEHLFRYIKAADVFVLNTGYEGLSHQLLEAMALGTPIVTTSIPGNAEMIEHKTTGILVGFNKENELSSGIRDALSGTKDIDAMAARAKEKAASFSKERMLEKTLAVLAQ